MRGGNRLSLEPERIATEALWDERHSARAWTGIVGFLDIPRDSALQRCDHLALGALKLMPDEPIAFLAAAGRRTHELQPVQDIQEHTAYSVLPCLCARRYRAKLLMRTLHESAVPSKWQCNDPMHGHVDDCHPACRIYDGSVSASIAPLSLAPRFRDVSVRVGRRQRARSAWGESNPPATLAPAVILWRQGNGVPDCNASRLHACACRCGVRLWAWRMLRTRTARFDLPVARGRRQRPR